MRSTRALVIAGATLKSMSATPIPTAMVSLPKIPICLSHLTQSVPTRLGTVSKSNLPSNGSYGAPAAAIAVSALVPTAPTSAVIPAFFRNALRLSPAVCDMDVLPRLSVSEQPFQHRFPLAAREWQHPTPVATGCGQIFRSAGSPPESLAVRGASLASHRGRQCACLARRDE